MFESLSAEIKALSAKIETKMSPDVSNISKTTISPNSSENSTQFPVLPVSPRGLPITAPVGAANGGMKLHPSVRVTKLTDSMEFSTPRIIPLRLISELTCDYIRAKPTFLRHPKRPAPVDGKYKQPEEISLDGPVSLANGTMSSGCTKFRILYTLKLTFLGVTWVLVLLGQPEESPA
ncbi:hypothetical protein ACTXT7_005787 [Hymenolepis weldensis]